MGRQPRRPTKTENGGYTPLTPERQQRIVESIKRGSYIEVACKAAGVSKWSFMRWMRLGADVETRDEETGELTLTPGIEPYRSFRTAAESAEAELEEDLTDRYREVSHQAAFGNANYMAGFMGRRFKDRWNPQTTIEVSGPEGGPIEVKGDDISNLSGTLEALARAGLVALPGGPALLPEGPDPTDQ